jgi:hypothetical protein
MASKTKKNSLSSAVAVEKLYNDTLEPYAKQLGLLIHDWNELHLEITSLFLIICPSHYSDDDEEREILLALWNAVPNERLQRDMLRKASKVRFTVITKRMEKSGIEINPITTHEAEILDHIMWILEKADSLGRKRDDSAHVPMILDATMPMVLRFSAFDDFGHPIARQLSGKDLLSEFGLYRARIQAVSRHANGLIRYLRGDRDRPQSLPEKPQWPSSPLSVERTAGKARALEKRRSRPPRPSRA